MVNAYASINKNDDIRTLSSSGAVFYEFASWIIENNGVVFGVSYDKKWNVKHIYAENCRDILSMLGSKYVQSSLGETYRTVKKFLKNGKLVLFSGTPCQISGLLAFLENDDKLDNWREKLILIDFICHGVPSPMVWRKYVEEKSYKKEVVGISFRDKSDGWRNFSFRIDYSDGSCYRSRESEDVYMQGFLKNIYLRPSCYECRFKGVERMADITLADFWGVQDILPEMYDDMGTSLVLVHTERGEMIWRDIAEKFNFCKIPVEIGTMQNNAAYYSAKRSNKRDLFYDDVRRNGVRFQTVARLIKVSMKDRVKKKIKHHIKRMLKTISR